MTVTLAHHPRSGDVAEPNRPAGAALHFMVIDGAADLAARLRDAGARVRSLTVRPAGGEPLDLRGVDFAVATPQLRALRITDAMVNGSVFAHPTLTRLSLDRVDYVGPADVVLADGIKWLRIEDSSVSAEPFTVGAASALRAFRWNLDVAAPPDRRPRRRLRLVGRN